VAASIVDWIEAYGERVCAGRYVVEKGFGSCYLARADGMY
jgi:hypothetical protein